MAKETKETKTGMRLAVNWLAALHSQKEGFTGATELMECTGVQAVAVTLGRDPMEIAFRVSNKMKEL